MSVQDLACLLEWIVISVFSDEVVEFKSLFSLLLVESDVVLCHIITTLMKATSQNALV